MRPLRIVLVLPDPPAPRGHPSARWFYVLLRGLVARGHRVTAFTACRDAAQMSEARSLFPDPAYDLRCFLYPERGWARSKWETLKQPFAYMFSDDLRGGLAARLQEGFDVLHLEQLTSGWLGLGHVDRALLVVHHLYAIDRGDERGGSLVARAERRLQRWTERRLLRRYRSIATVSERLAAAVRARSGRARVAAIPLAIDLAHHPYIPDAERGPEPIVGLIGNMAWAPSRAAAERLLTRLWPRIAAEVPEARLEIAGWSARRVLSAHLGVPGVTIDEDVPDVLPYLRRASVLVYAPGRGSGVKVKLLEALASGVPVVTNGEGAEGLEGVTDGVELGLADDDAGLVSRAVDLLRAPERRALQRERGRAWVERRSPEVAMERLEQRYEELSP